MFTTILGSVAVLAIVAVTVILTPSEPWALDGEIWYEQFEARRGRDAVAEELQVMRIEAEAEAIVSARQPSRTRPVVATFGDVAPGSGRHGAPNQSW